MIDAIEKKVNNIEPFLIDIRRHLHKNPELSGKEYNTADYIYNKLQEAGIKSEIIKTKAGPAVIADIVNDPDFPTIAFRSDMDALPIEDKSIKPYASKICGICHACGHDFNISTVIGTAYVLAFLKNKMKINIRFIFQPSEEAKEGGAYALVENGVMDNISGIWTIHANPAIDAGKIGIKFGPVTAGVDTFKITVKGKGGHSARPHQAVDSIYVANQILNFLYSNVTRNFDPFFPIVLSVGKIQAGSAPNVISENCTIEGTVRSFDKEVRRKLYELIKEKVESISDLYGASSSLDWNWGPPPVVNDDVLGRLTDSCASKIVGLDNIVKTAKPSMGAEDFSVYLEKAPGVLVRIGTGGKDSSYPLHSCNFDIDERAIGITVKLLSLIAFDFQDKIVEDAEKVEKWE